MMNCLDVKKIKEGEQESFDFFNCELRTHVFAIDFSFLDVHSRRMYSLNTTSEDIVSGGNQSNVSKRMLSTLATAKPPHSRWFFNKGRSDGYFRVFR